MTCAPCLRARRAAVAVVRDITAGHLSEAKRDAGEFVDALKEKAESLRIRERLFGPR